MHCSFTSNRSLSYLACYLLPRYLCCIHRHAVLECSCLKILGWPMPKWYTCSLPPSCGSHAEPTRTLVHGGQNLSASESNVETSARWVLIIKTPFNQNTLCKEKIVPNYKGSCFAARSYFGKVAVKYITIKNQQSHAMNTCTTGCCCGDDDDDDEIPGYNGRK